MEDCQVIEGVTAVVLAAGFSQRFGSQKLLHEISGKAIILRSIESLREGGVNSIIVVTGSSHDGIFSIVHGLNLKVVQNLRPEDGMFSSVRSGIRAAGSDCNSICILPGDMPYVKSDTIGELLSFRGNERILIPTFNGKGGHPLIFGSEYFESVLNSHENDGLRGFISSNRHNVCRIPVHDSGVLRDIDTREDLLVL